VVLSFVSAITYSFSIINIMITWIPPSWYRLRGEEPVRAKERGLHPDPWSARPPRRICRNWPIRKRDTLPDGAVSGWTKRRKFPANRQSASIRVWRNRV